MPVVRCERNSDFTVISNHYLRDKNLSLKSKGLLSIILSLPDDWEYSVAGLASICAENETAVKSALSELKKNGYLVVAKKMPGETKSGRIEYEYTFFEQPCQKQEGEKQGIEILPLEIQDVEIQGIEIQEVENQPQLNTYISNKEDKNISSKSDDEADGQLLLVEENQTGTADNPEKKNIITMSIRKAAEIIYKAYPRKEGKAKGFEQVRQWLKGKRISGMGRIKFNHEQLYCAVKEYAICCEENGTELKFIQLFGTFMGRTILDYVEKSAPGYENYMRREYGEEWRDVNFEYS